MNRCKCVTDFMNTPLSDDSMLHQPLDAADNTILARIYTPAQVPGELYTLCEALEKGTVYPELDQPYYCSQNCCRVGTDGEEILPASEVRTAAGEKEGCKNVMCK